MEKSLKSTTQYTTDDVIGLQNVIALQVYNHGDLPLKINGIVIMPKEIFPLVTPDGCLSENYQVTPEFFDLNTIAFYFPSLDAKSLATQPKFTLLSSVFDGANEPLTVTIRSWILSSNCFFYVNKPGNYRVYFNRRVQPIYTQFPEVTLDIFTDVLMLNDGNIVINFNQYNLDFNERKDFTVQNIGTGETSQQFFYTSDF